MKTPRRKYWAVWRGGNDMPCLAGKTQRDADELADDDEQVIQVCVHFYPWTVQRSARFADPIIPTAKLRRRNG